jgi:ElaB/YqjD/DUF883 family membrane-anchored ribosome-binding protein
MTDNVEQIKIKTAEALEEAARKLRSADIEEANNIMSDVESDMDQFKREFVARYHHAETGYHKAMEPVETMISDHPIPAVMIALGLGFLLGMFICRSRDR